MADITGLFATPLMQVNGALSAALAAKLAQRAVESAKTRNVHSDQLAHTEIATPEEDPDFAVVEAAVRPYLVEFGSHLFGERLDWSVKEIWTNVLRRGGNQSVHSHANSFISGIIYLTHSHPSSRTVFHKALGGTEYVFSNFNKQAKIGPFNGSKWVSPPKNPGDLLLYPSYLLHEVPTNQGDLRITLALNAIPDRLDSWGYRVSFSK